MRGVVALSAVALMVLALDACTSHASVAKAKTDVTARERCEDLVDFFDRWGSTRSGHTDGARNHIRIAAKIDCERGDYVAGIARMEALLAARKFEIPTDVGEAPMYFPDEEAAEAEAR
jgi:hypothetical protein